MIMQLLDSDWPANILAGMQFWAQENGLMSPVGLGGIGKKQMVYLLIKVSQYY